MRPRVLFVSRERHRLPLEAEQKRKWDALSELLDVRVLAAAAEGSTGQDPRFALVARAHPTLLDGPLFYAGLAPRVALELRRFRPDAVLVQGVHETAAVLAARRLAGSRTRVVLDVHGDWRQATRLYGSRGRALLSPLADALAPLAVRRADAVRTLSPTTTGLVRSLGVEPAAVFPAYIDAEAFSDPLVPLPARPAALFVGVLERTKGFDTLVGAWPLAASRVPEATLRIVGRGRLAGLLDPLPERVSSTPRLSQTEVAEALDAATVLCLPSRSEGFGRVVIEAFSRGRAVIGARSGGVRDLVEDEVNGLLVGPGDERALADALVRVLSDRLFAERLGAGAAASSARWSATPEEYAARVEALIRSATA